MTRSPVILALLSAASAWGQPTQFSGVLSGVLFDPPVNSIRSVLGVPGGARLGPYVASGIDTAWMSPDGRSAVTLQQGQIVGIRIAADGSAATVSLDGAQDQLNVSWSSDSVAAVLWYRQQDGTAAFRVWQPGQTPNAALPTSYAFASLRAVAIRARTSEFFLAIQNSDQSGIYRVSFAGDTAQLAAPGKVEAMTLDAAGLSLYYVTTDTSFGRLTLDSPGASPTVISGPTDGATCPCWLAAPAQGNLIALAGTGAATVWLLDTTGNAAPQAIALDSAATGLLPSGTSQSFILSLRGATSASALLLDIPTGNVYFIPDGPSGK